METNYFNYTKTAFLTSAFFALCSWSDFTAQTEPTIEDKNSKAIADDTTKIKIGNITIIIDNGDSTKISEDDFNFEEEEEDEKSSFGLTGLMNVGMNGWLTADNQTAFPSAYNNMAVNYSKSRLFGFDFMLKGLDLFNKHLYVSPGLGVSWNNYHFNEKITMSTGPDTLVFMSDTITNYTKYKFRTTYLSVPLVIGTRIGNVNEKHLDFHAGIIGSFNVNSVIKQKYNVDGTNNKDKINDDFNVNPFKLEAIARLSFGAFGLYGKYSFTEQFQPNKTQAVYPFSIGVTFGNIGG
jgi:hypothetical protein